MRVSELAKELGYRAAELVELAKQRGLQIASIKDNVDARSAAAIRAQVPHRSRLAGALKELYEKVQADLARQEAERPAKIKEPSTKTRRIRKTEEVAAAGGAVPAEAKAPAPEAKPETKPKTVRKKKVVEEFHLGADAAAAAKHEPPAPVVRKPAMTEEEKKELRAAAATPLIDVDKVIGVEKDVRVVRTAEIDQLERAKQEEEKEKRKARPAPQTEAMRPRGRRVKEPPIARPTVVVLRQKPIIINPEDRDYEIQVPITLKDFSQQVGVKVSDLIRRLMEMGQMVTMNSVLDADAVELLAHECKRRVKVVRSRKAEEVMIEEAKEESRAEDRMPRLPVVTFLGHVDHGKTSLLDRLRNTNVAAGEAGGITQHIGASKVKAPSGQEIVFLDTPGHEAFTAMRARGAQATDLVVLVVAADDGVMPQTEEAYNHAKAAKVPVIIAVNKMDKKGANVNKVKGQLASIGLQTEDWGGSTSCVEVSALTGLNVDKLLETICLEAELLELKANPKLRARGVVLEARKTDDRGVVATLLVQDGTLRRGETLLSGRAHGRIRSMHDDRGKALEEAPPATPVEISGLDEVPDVGEKFQALEDLAQAKEVAEERRNKEREATRLEQGRHVTLENLFQKIESGRMKEVKVVIKVDTGGSKEVLVEALQGLSTKEVKLSVLHSGMGAVTESDVILADASDAIIVAFYVDVEPRATVMAKEKGVEIRSYRVIYEAIEEMKAALEGLLEPEKVAVTLGHLVVKEVFRISRVGAIAGCFVTGGKIERSASVKLIRNGKIVHEGRIESLKRFKDDVRDVAEGYECGVKIAGHDDIHTGDVLEVFAIQSVARKLEKKT